jgi:hypothetical protein
LSHQYLITRICGAIAGRGTTLPLIAVVACLPTLVCCSSVSNMFTALFESSRNNLPPETPAAPVLTASPPISDVGVSGIPLAGASPPHATAPVTPGASTAVPASTPSITGQIAPSPPSETPTSPTVPVPAISDDFDAAASVYPSVALFDEIRKSRDAQLSSQRLGPPNLSDSFAPVTPLTAKSQQPPPTTRSGSEPAATAAPLASAASDEYDPAASAYPSVALFDLIRKSRDSQLSSQTASPPNLSESSAPGAPATLSGQRTPTP